jgi:hypothetical protein
VSDESSLPDEEDSSEEESDGSGFVKESPGTDE